VSLIHLIQQHLNSLHLELFKALIIIAVKPNTDPAIDNQNVELNSEY
jgi:hypothetical protein